MRLYIYIYIYIYINIYIFIRIHIEVYFGIDVAPILIDRGSKMAPQMAPKINAKTSKNRVPELARVSRRLFVASFFNILLSSTLASICALISIDLGTKMDPKSSVRTMF